MEFSAGQIADILEGIVEGNANVVVSRLSKIEEGEEGSLTFLANPKYQDFDLVLYIPRSEDGQISKLFNKAKVYFKESPSVAAQTNISLMINQSLEEAKLKDYGISEETYANIKAQIDVDFIDIKTIVKSQFIS